MHWIGITTKMLLLIQAQREDYCRLPNYYPKLKQSLTIDIENYCALIFGVKKEIEGNTRKLHLGNFTCKTKKIRIGHAY